MASGDPILRRADGEAPTVTLTYDGSTLPARTVDTVTSALFAAGIVATGRSLKYRRPRGPFCLRGDCGTCLVRMGGVPNERACVSMVRDGLAVEPQNRVLSGGPDPTALVDRMFSSELDHHHLMVRPRLVNRLMQEVARNLAGLGTLPDADAPTTVAEVEDVDVLVVGGGAAGRAVAGALASLRHTVACVERFDAPEGSIARSRTAAFGIYPAESVVAAIDSARPTRVLRQYRPRHLVLATGARDVILPVRNNDLPGVVAAGGLAATLERSRSVLACPAVVVGTGAHADALGERLGLDVLAPESVEAILGGGRVEAIATRSGKREVGCVALAAPPAPASELARQGGGKVAWDGGGFAVVRDADGRVAAAGPWQTWACGQVCGVAPAASAADALRVADSIARALASTGGGVR